MTKYPVNVLNNEYSVGLKTLITYHVVKASLTGLYFVLGFYGMCLFAEQYLNGYSFLLMFGYLALFDSYTWRGKEYSILPDTKLVSNTSTVVFAFFILYTLGSWLV